MVSGSDGLDPRVADLVQREIDGANTKAESMELESAVKRDPLARQALEEFTGLARGLDGLASVAPPAEIKRAVMHEITTRSQPPRRSEGGILAWLWPGRGPALRYAWIVVMVAGLGLVATYWRTLNHIDVDGGSVSGTLAPATADRPAAWTIDVEGVTGSMRSVDDAAGLGIAFDLSGAGPLGVVFEFDGAAARFAGIEGGSPEGTQAEDGRVRIPVTSGRPVTARFVRLGKPSGLSLGIRLERAETVLEEWTIAFPGRQVSR
jgi:hypothetical protein